MCDQTCDLRIKIESFDILRRSDYEGKLSTEDTEFLQAQYENINYMINNDAELTIQFRQSYRSIELLTKMVAEYDIELCYSNHSMKFKRCVFDSIKSVSNSGDILVEAKFICKAKPGMSVLSVGFEHVKTDD